MKDTIPVPPTLAESLLEKHALTQLWPGWKANALALVVWDGDANPRVCLHLGFAILFDKPIIILAATNKPVPVNLRRCASEVVTGSPSDPLTSELLNNAICSVLQNDRRMRR